MKIIGIYSNKGGVGKTATAVNLAYRNSCLGHRTLLCDFDSQGAASYYFRVRPKKKFNKSKLFKGKIEKFIRGTDYENLDLLPSHRSFRNLDLALVKSETRDKAHFLGRVFSTLQDEYDVLVLDCPPNVSLLGENILRSTDIVVTPIVPTTLSILALKQLMKMMDRLGLPRKKIAPFFSMVQKRKRLHCDTIMKYRKNKVFLKTSIPFISHVERMGVERRPVAVSFPHSEIEMLYNSLQREVWNRSSKL